MVQETLPHLNWNFSPISSQLTPSEFHFFPASKEAPEEMHFRTDEKVKTIMKQFFRIYNTHFFPKGFLNFGKFYDKYINVIGDCAEKIQ